MNESTHAIVYVHGISRHEAGYSDAWHDALDPHLECRLTNHEVLWSDLVNASRMLGTGADPEKWSEEARLRAQIETELSTRRVANGQVTPASADGSYQAVSSALDDFVRYMVWEDTRDSILARFEEITVPLLEAGRSVHVIAHSWGTVVAYEGLRRLDQNLPAGRVANLITLGSALSIPAVQRNLFGRVADGRLPQAVDSFINVDAGGDIVGGRLSPPFNDVTEFLQRVPTGCSMYWLRRLRGEPTAKNPFCAHSSYFLAVNTAVQRDIIARFINQALSQR